MKNVKENSKEKVFRYFGIFVLGAIIGALASFLFISAFQPIYLNSENFWENPPLKEFDTFDYGEELVNCPIPASTVQCNCIDGRNEYISGFGTCETIKRVDVQGLRAFGTLPCALDETYVENQGCVSNRSS